MGKLIWRPWWMVSGKHAPRPVLCLVSDDLDGYVKLKRPARSNSFNIYDNLISMIYDFTWNFNFKNLHLHVCVLVLLEIVVNCGLCYLQIILLDRR